MCTRLLRVNGTEAVSLLFPRKTHVVALLRAVESASSCIPNTNPYMPLHWL